jgi:hypothetical protein
VTTAHLPAEYAQTQPSVHVLDAWQTSVGLTVFGMLLNQTVLNFTVLPMVRLRTLPSLIGGDNAFNLLFTVLIVGLSVCSLIGLAYVFIVYPLCFRSRSLASSHKLVSFLNGLVGGVLFGPMWNTNLTKKKKGVSYIVFGLLAAVLLISVLVAAPFVHDPLKQLYLENSAASVRAQASQPSTQEESVSPQGDSVADPPAQSNPPVSTPTPEVPRPEAFETYSFPDTGFEARFPYEPVVNEMTSDFDGEALTTTSYACYAPDFSYSVTVLERPSILADSDWITESARGALDDYLDILIEVRDAKVLSRENESETQGYPSASAVLSMEQFGVENTCYMKVFLKDNVYYDVILYGITDTDAEAFYSSFRFL